MPATEIRWVDGSTPNYSYFYPVGQLDLYIREAASFFCTQNTSVRDAVLRFIRVTKAYIFFFLFPFCMRQAELRWSGAVIRTSANPTDYKVSITAITRVLVPRGHSSAFNVEVAALVRTLELCTMDAVDGASFRIFTDS